MGYDESSEIHTIICLNLIKLKRYQLHSYNIQVVIFERLKVLTGHVFSNFSLLRVFVAKLEKIGSYCFSNCNNLQFIDLSRITMIPAQAFKNCFKLGN